MQIELLLPVPARVWHERLRRLLLARGHQVVARFVEDAPSRPPGIEVLRQLEATLYRSIEGGGASGPCEDLRAEQPTGETQLCIDLTGSPAPVSAPCPCLLPLADGEVGESAALLALAEGRSPELTVICLRDGGQILLAKGLAGLEEPHQLVRSLDRVCGRWADLIALAVRTLEGGSALEPAKPPLGPSTMGPLALSAAALSRIGARITDRLRRLSGGQTAWRIAWRRTGPGEGLRDRLAWLGGDYAVLPDDGARYYADPFLFTHQDRTWLFCEEFPYATGRGLLSVLELGPEGVQGVPRPVLEQDCHLSYPQVFAHEGQVFMIPETSGRGTIELWRAEQLPDRWEKLATMVTGVCAADVTLIRHGGLWWLFAALSEPGHSSWDTLGLFHAPRLEGPWTPHGANPAVIDARSARPAGRAFLRNGELWRPVQDCSEGYGSRLAFARIEQLNPESFVQTVAVSLAPPARWHARGVHTLDAMPGLEVIDVLCPPAQRLAGGPD